MVFSLRTHLEEKVLGRQQKLELTAARLFGMRVLFQCTNARRNPLGHVVVIIVPKHNVVGTCGQCEIQATIAELAYRLAVFHAMLLNLGMLLRHTPVLREVIGVVHHNPEVGLLNLLVHAHTRPFPCPTAVTGRRTHHNHTYCWEPSRISFRHTGQRGLVPNHVRMHGRC